MGVWIETVFNRPIKRVTQSLLMWECGLKHYVDGTIYKAAKSLLMWECGLKQMKKKIKDGDFEVTPYVGVWIET